MRTDYTISLTESELIVLDATLDRLAERDDFERLVPDRADRQAIHNLVALLERVNPIVFSDDFDAHLAEARGRVLTQP
jgi:hypothetical protein